MFRAILIIRGSSKVLFVEDTLEAQANELGLFLFFGKWRRAMKRKAVKVPTLPPLRWWVFKLRSGEIVKGWGRELRDDDENFFSVHNEHICTQRVRKSNVIDRWAQDQETTLRETL